LQTVASSTPANRFVASFIGSPAMNLLDGTIDGSDGAPVARLADGTAINVAAGRKLTMGQKVTVGLRPEHLTPGTGGDTTLTGRTLLVEPTGAQAHVLFELAGQHATAIVDGDYPIKSGQPFNAAIARAQVHIFDAATGVSL
jgi:multiple sugar transport system ATP-binding protein